MAHWYHGIPRPGPRRTPCSVDPAQHEYLALSYPFARPAFCTVTLLHSQPGLAHWPGLAWPYEYSKYAPMTLSPPPSLNPPPPHPPSPAYASPLGYGGPALAPAARTRRLPWCTPPYRAAARPTSMVASRVGAVGGCTGSYEYDYAVPVTSCEWPMYGPGLQPE